uniref:Putative secreted protein n=1 Tax=Ixodes ricinus TaxID=34613 RepID=A0A6B0UAF1_IXORI
MILFFVLSSVLEQVLEEKSMKSSMRRGVSGKAGVVTSCAFRVHIGGVDVLQLRHLKHLWALRGPTRTEPTKRPCVRSVMSRSSRSG